MQQDSPPQPKVRPRRRQAFIFLFSSARGGHYAAALCLVRRTNRGN